MTSTSHQPCYTEKITVPILQNDIAEVPALFCFAWAVTLGVYLESRDLEIAFALTGSEVDTETTANAGTYSIRIQPEQNTTDALDALSCDESHIPGRGEKWPAVWTELVIRRKQTGETRCLEGHSGNERSPEVIITLDAEQGLYSIQGAVDTAVVPITLARVMLHQFVFAVREIFQTLTTNAAARVRDLQMISPNGMAQLTQWNGEPGLQEDWACAHHLIERQCQRQPQAVAVCAWDGSWSYEELDCEASQIAWQLSDHGIGPGRFVGLMFEKSKWMTVAMLGVLKAGGAFVLLDPAQPVAYLSSICATTRAALLLSSCRHRSLAVQLEHVTIEVPGDVQQRKVGTDFAPSLQRFPTAVQPHHDMYACFTSGSTGKPKGFSTQHGAFTSGLQLYANAVGLTSDSRVFQFASHSFAPSITDQLVPLVIGACVCLPAEEQLQSNAESSIIQLQANWLKLTPSVARTLDPARVSCVNTIVFVGEQIQEHDTLLWRKFGITVLGLYGQSENAKGSMVSHKSEGADPCSIGSPFCATGWIVDPDDIHRLMPVGAKGELLLESPCLARGYIDNEAETKTVFVEPPPWMAQVRHNCPTKRFLRTGDIVRYNCDDGSFVLMGRKGNRVKIRGQRLELAQVEHNIRACLSTTAPILADLVQPAKDDGQDPILVAFVAHSERSAVASGEESFFASPTEGFRAQAQAVLDKLRHLLPAFMVPSTVLPVIAMPYTRTGKLHRRRLREEASMFSRTQLLGYISARAPYRAPETKLETGVQRACARVLNVEVEAIGMEDNFFDLGGNSLTARQLAAAASAEGIQLRAAEIFQQPTLAKLAQTHDHALSQRKPCGGSLDPGRSLREEVRRDGLPGISPDNIEDALPVLFTQLCTAREDRVDFFILRVVGRLDPEKLRLAWVRVIQTLPILRTVFLPFRGRLIQLVLQSIADSQFYRVVESPEGKNPEEWAHILCAEEQIHRYPVDRPTVQLTLIQAPVSTSALILRICHAQYDGLSLQPLVEILMRAYHDRPLLVESNFKAYLGTCLQLRTPETLSFWRQLLAGSSPTQLKDLNPRGRVTPQYATRQVYSRQISGLTAAPAGFTLATVIKAAWSWVLKKKSQSEDVVFGQLVSCRVGLPLPSADKIVGPCMNIVPVRVRYQTGWTGWNLLHSVQAQHAQTMDSEMVGMHDIVEHCTSWPAGTEPDSVVMHENFQVEWEVQDGEVTCKKMAAIFSPQPAELTFLMTIPKDTGLTAVLLAERELTSTDADQLLDLFCETMTNIVWSPDAVLH